MRRSRTADIVLSKWIGLKGSAIIAAEREKELLGYFSPYFVETVKGFDKALSVEEEADIAKEHGALLMREVKEGGIYGCLWDSAAELETGIDVYLRRIPVKQETIEVANFFDIDPYLLCSHGSLLAVAENGQYLADALNERGINAAVIGRLTDSNDRVIINNGSRRFLSPRYKDELYKVVKGASNG